MSTEKAVKKYRLKEDEQAKLGEDPWSDPLTAAELAKVDALAARAGRSTAERYVRQEKWDDMQRRIASAKAEGLPDPTKPVFKKGTVVRTVDGHDVQVPFMPALDATTPREVRTDEGICFFTTWGNLEEVF